METKKQVLSIHVESEIKHRLKETAKHESNRIGYHISVSSIAKRALCIGLNELEESQ